jgi:hypothetical protein
MCQPTNDSTSTFRPAIPIGHLMFNNTVDIREEEIDTSDADVVNLNNNIHRDNDDFSGYPSEENGFYDEDEDEERDRLARLADLNYRIVLHLINSTNDRIMNLDFEAKCKAEEHGTGTNYGHVPTR